ncbi:hypothetical protein D3C87_1523300 [compost metagenome]
MFLRCELGEHGVADTEVATQANADQYATEEQRHRRLDIELHHRGDGDQDETDEEDFLPADLVGNPAEKQAAEEQADQRRSPYQALPECIELHLWAQQCESDTDQAEDVAVGEMRAESQAGDLDVKAPDGQVVDFYRLYGHVSLQLLLLTEK